MTAVPLLYSVLKEGLDVLVASNKTKPYCSVWVELTEVNDSKGRGILSKFHHPEFKGKVLAFKLEEIVTVRGTKEWNVENLSISCSKKVVEGEPVGYFYNAMLEKPLHYGRHFYAISEINSDKSEIELYDFPLTSLLSINKDVFPHIEAFAYFGFLKNSKGTLTELSETDIKNKNRKVFPCLFEIDNLE